MSAGAGARRPGGPLRVAALVKQVPVPESLRLQDGRLVRTGVAFEMNAFCRRAVSQGVRLARDTGGSCTVVTLGPPSAEDVLREAGPGGPTKDCTCATVPSPAQTRWPPPAR